MTASSSASFGPTLRRWREVRRLSQLHLALEAGVSQRHVSFLESGRASPSREMVVLLAGALDVPLRERNALLLAAGFAPIYAERALDSDALGQVRHVLDVILRAHGPLPAFVVDRAWNVVLSNEAARRLTARFVEPDSRIVASRANLFRLLLHPEGIRSSVVNWAAVATILLERLDREVSARPEDALIQRLAAELRSYPGVGDLVRRPRLPSASDLLVPIHLRTTGLELHLFTAVATIGSPLDITLEELRIETLLPADQDSEATLHALAAD